MLNIFKVITALEALSFTFVDFHTFKVSRSAINDQLCAPGVFLVGRLIGPACLLKR